MVTLLHHYCPTVVTGGLVDNRVETYGQERVALGTRKQRLVDKRVEICEHESEDFWKR